MAADVSDGFLHAGHATPVNRSETRELSTLIEGVELATGAYVYAEKGYCSGENRDFLSAQGLKDATMDKAPRHGALTASETIAFSCRNPAKGASARPGWAKGRIQPHA